MVQAKEEQFIQRLTTEYGKHPVSILIVVMVLGIHPQAYKFLKLKYHLHSSFEKSIIIERTIQSVLLVVSVTTVESLVVFIMKNDNDHNKEISYNTAFFQKLHGGEKITRTREIKRKKRTINLTYILLLLDVPSDKGSMD
jgi:hypothetical protein